MFDPRSRTQKGLTCICLDLITGPVIRGRAHDRLDLLATPNTILTVWIVLAYPE